VSDLGSQRHLARERALELLYESEIKERPIAAIINDLTVRPDAYVLTLLFATEAHRDRSHELISEYSIDWPLDRIALLDRLVLTLALGEFLMDDAPPKAVILDEAVELAKTYSTDNSPSFVNGLLSAITDALLD